jgi:hypothetical protein
VLFIVTAETQLGFQRNSIRKSTFHTLLYRIAGRINKVIEEFEYKNVAGIGDRKVLFEYFKESFVVTLVGRSFQLEEILKGLDLNLQQIGSFLQMLDLTEIHTLVGSHCC